MKMETNATIHLEKKTMEIFDMNPQKKALMKTFYVEQASCALRGMLMSLFAELFEEDILTGDISEFMACYFADNEFEPDTQTALEIIEEAEGIFKSEDTHSRWLRKAQLFRQCVKKFNELHADLRRTFEDDDTADEETDETL